MTIESYPCPKCGEHRLIYEGMLVWRSGPRPPRELARKQVGFSPRADYERERLYRCGHCGAEFFQNAEQRGIRLHEENVSGEYLYNSAWRAWEIRRFDPAKREWTIQRLEPQRARQPKPGRLGVLAKTAHAALSSLAGGGEEYIVQENDSLSKLAGHFCGESAAWTAIWTATNLKFIEDDSFAIVVEPDVLRAGQKLWIPNARQAKRFSTESEGKIAGVFFAPSTGPLVVRDKSGRTRGRYPADGFSGSSWHLLRFYQDGLVLDARIQTEDPTQSWPKISSWFHRDNANPAFASGKYRRIGDRVSLFIDSEQGKAYYTGVCSKEKLQLSSKEHKAREYLRLDAA